MNKPKINVIIGVSVGLLAGFVFGAAYCSLGGSLKSEGNLKGNVSAIRSFKYGKVDSPIIKSIEKDTLKYSMTDEQGIEWNVTLTRK